MSHRQFEQQKAQHKSQMHPANKSQSSPRIFYLSLILLIILLAIAAYLYLPELLDKQNNKTNKAIESKDTREQSASDKPEEFIYMDKNVEEQRKADQTEVEDKNLSSVDSKNSLNSESQLSAEEIDKLKKSLLMQNFNPADLSSKAFLLADFESGAILAEQNSLEKLNPASLTKVMTALLSLEHYPDLQANYEVDAVDAKKYEELYVLQASLAGFNLGDTVSVEGLLYGVMLPSGADACHILARHISEESGKDFVQMMNNKAQHLAMANTNFINPTGMPGEGFFSCAKDMAKLFYTACKKPEFVKISGTHSYTFDNLIREEGPLTIISTFTWKFNSLEEFPKNTVVLAGKSGYSGQEQSLATLFEKNGRRFILVTMGAETDDPGAFLSIQDHALIMANLLK